MTPRPELSNSRIEIATGENALSCLTRPKPTSALVAMAMVVVLLMMVPAYFLVEGVLRTRDHRDPFTSYATAVASCIVTVPAAIVLLIMIRRGRRRCGFAIVENTVTLHTPDTALSKHVFDLKELKGATLSGRGKRATLVIERRKGFSVLVFISYPTVSLTAAMDAINKLVIHDRVHGFEVIPMATSILPDAGVKTPAPIPIMRTMDPLIERNREEILRLAAKHGAGNVRVFGSRARGDHRADSDLDLIVERTGSRTPVWPGGLIEDLQQLLGIEVNVTTPKGLHWFIRDRVLQEALRL